ncbi:prepilin-type N-terminal cleavage/methylation domain-containing protein [Neiella marina]|uniref:Prepilin-type N-terminal cleavage/methylation domain-containing protein n=1 Tax=Neiella holothuriorum TaxID=2870530 RepID=A0ABS7EBU5_9GAMM|nr:prepilin-type N-terminal cleavage/methylation domain-containing protein [Neiella holothuriorum]MBW8189443.1 prepilin-type N-terminal cleavage/methylation domain-containing protein [Neiella holothuriorum]
MKATQAGFSLIELVIVVTILGLLAVTALPRFLDVTEEAQIANIEGMAGGFATGVSLVRAQWEAEGRPQEGSGDSAVNSVVYDGQLMYLTSELAGTSSPGYPVNSGSGNTDTSITMDTTRCMRVWNSILQNPATVTDTIGEAADNRYFASVEAGDCVYHLTQTLERDSSGNYTAPDGTDDGNNFVYSPGFGSVRVNINSN